MTLAFLGVGLLAVAFIIWKLLRTGAQVGRGKAAEETLDEVRNVGKPATDADVKRVREKYRHD